MANRTYLIYQQKNNEYSEFEYATNIPSLWQELYDIQLIEIQKNQIIETFNKNSDQENSTSLKVLKETALENIKRKNNLNENEDKTQLRKDFINFIQSEIAENSEIELYFEEISWFYDEPEEVFLELEKFHKDPQTQIEYQKEKVTFQTIGFNEDFAPFSSIYQKMVAEAKIIDERYEKQHQINEEKARRKEKRSKRLDLITMSLGASVLTFFGVFGIFIKNDTSAGFSFLLFAIICWIYVYFKQK